MSFSLGSKYELGNKSRKAKMNYSRLKMRTGENNDPECLEYLSLTGTVFFLPLLWALTLTSLFIIF